MNKSNGKCQFCTGYVENIDICFMTAKGQKKFYHFAEPRSKNHVEFTFSKLNVLFGFATREHISNVCNFIY